MNTGDVVAKWRAMSPGKGAAAFWGALTALLLLAALPLVLLSMTAPSSKAEKPLEDGRRLAASARNAAPDSSPSTVPSLPGIDDAGSKPPVPQRPATPGAPALSTLVTPAAADHVRATDFDLQCWPTMSVVPGTSSTIDCDVSGFNGDGTEISLTCRAEGMVCRMSPETVKDVKDNRTVVAKLTVTAPGSASVGTYTAKAMAAGGETGAALEETEVDVSVPPPFSVSCESIGAAFEKGADARIKCWVAFQEGSADDVALTIKNPREVPATLDVAAVRGVPNQTRSFTILLSTEQLESRSYMVRITASSLRYSQEAGALFQILPA